MALNLAYAGSQHFVIADHDTIELSNLNRQPYNRFDVGNEKVDALEQRLRAINPYVTVQKYTDLNQDNIQFKKFDPIFPEDCNIEDIHLVGGNPIQDLPESVLKLDNLEYLSFSDSNIDISKPKIQKIIETLRKRYGSPEVVEFY